MKLNRNDLPRNPTATIYRQMVAKFIRDWRNDNANTEELLRSALLQELQGMLRTGVRCKIISSETDSALWFYGRDLVVGKLK